MTETDLTKKVLDALFILNTAIKNIRLYPATNPLVAGSIDRLDVAFSDLLAREDKIVFAESERVLLICGEALSPRDLEKPHPLALLNMLLQLGLKSLTFDRGLEKEELARFVELIARPPEHLQAGGGLPKLMADSQIVHIVPDEKIFVAVDKDRRILSSLDVTDDQISRFFMLTHPDLDVHSESFKKMARDPDLLSKAFEAGLSKMMAQKDKLSSVQVTENLQNMLGLLDRISATLDGDPKERLSRQVARSLLEADPEIAQELTTQRLEHLLGGLLLQYLSTELALGRAGLATNGGPTGQGEGKDRLMQVTRKLIDRLGDDRTLKDDALMSVLPKIIEQLLAEKEQQSVDALIERLLANLESDDLAARDGAAKALADIFDQLQGEAKTRALKNAQSRLLSWIGRETSLSVGYRRICFLIKDTALSLLEQLQFDEALNLISVFRAVAEDRNGGSTGGVGREMIAYLASEKNVNLLVAQYNDKESGRDAAAADIFAALSNTALNRLLDMLRDQPDSDERVRMMHLIICAGPKALDVIKRRIRQDEPWYYLRNLVYMLGFLGNEETAGLIQPLLRHDNERLRAEALRCIQKTGGTRRAAMLLPVLRDAQEDFKISLVDALGTTKAPEAVAVLIALLKNRPVKASASRVALEEKICQALDAIGSPDAIPALSEIAETKKSLLGPRLYADTVRAAAAVALSSLRRKLAESGDAP